MQRMRVWMVLFTLLMAIVLVGCGPAAEDATNINVDLPEAALRAQQALATNLGVQVSQVQVVEVEPQDWSDSCLGLGGPAESCAAVITPGYQVTLEVNGEQYVFRTDQAGEAIREATGQ